MAGVAPNYQRGHPDVASNPAKVEAVALAQSRRFTAVVSTRSRERAAAMGVGPGAA